MTDLRQNAEPLDEEAIELLVAEVTDEFIDRAQRGEQPDVNEFAARYPQIGGILRQLLPALRALHQSSGEGSGTAHHAASPLPIGLDPLGQLGDFRLIREVGRGGMGVVYEAEQVSLGRRVALKVLPLAAALDPRQLQRFRLEAQAAAHLHHSHIVPIHSVGCERGVYYYAMQFVEGRSLADVIAELRQHERRKPQAAGSPDSTREQPAAPSAHSGRAGIDTLAERRLGDATLQSVRSSGFFRTVAALGIQAAEALEYAHGMGVVHRDVKPANLLLDMEGYLYVADFGLAQLQGDTQLTMTGDLVGTLRYMSPEQTMARRGLVDHRADIYSLGATLYELLTLAPVFDASDRHALLRQISEQEPIAPRQQNKAIPIDLETIVLKALAKEPERRYATARELADDLARFLDHKTISARRPTVPELASRWLRRHRAVVAATVGLLLLATIGFAVSTALIAREQWKTRAAYNRLTEQQARTTAAFEAEARERARAEKSFGQARQIVDFFTEVSEEELADKAELQGLRRMLLAASLDYYQGFIEQASDDPSLQTQLAASHLHVAGILDEIGSKSEALAALERARQLQEKLIRNQPLVPELQAGLMSIYGRFDSLRGGRELNLLGERTVQEDLHLTPDQIKQLDELLSARRHGFHELHQLTLDDWHQRFANLEQQESVLANLLEPTQAKRLRQIALQQRGPHAFNDPDIAEQLELTAEQRDRIRPLQADTRRFLSARFGTGNLSPKDWQRVKDSWNHAWDQILSVLTDEQRAEWQEMTGEPFAGKLRSPMREGYFPGRGPRPFKPHAQREGNRAPQNRETPEAADDSASTNSTPVESHTE